MEPDSLTFLTVITKLLRRSTFNFRVEGLCRFSPFSAVFSMAIYLFGSLPYHHLSCREFNIQNVEVFEKFLANLVPYNNILLGLSKSFEVVG